MYLKASRFEQKGIIDILRLAAKREILEEVVLYLKDELKYIISNYFVDSIGSHVIDTIFHRKIEKTDLTIVKYNSITSSQTKK